ncbi:hypothetical protein BC629DRAFT_1072444 [Irpex lacteus]|nr:hypothetical protein BC629DRAFT_1072444 [Irpex lacteus]
MGGRAVSLGRDGFVLLVLGEGLGLPATEPLCPRMARLFAPWRVGKWPACYGNPSTRHVRLPGARTPIATAPTLVFFRASLCGGFHRRRGPFIPDNALDVDERGGEPSNVVVAPSSCP